MEEPIHPEELSSDKNIAIARQIKKLCVQLGVCVILMLGLAFTVVLVAFGDFGSKEYAAFPDGVYYLDYNVYNLSNSAKNQKIKEGSRISIFRNTINFRFLEVLGSESQFHFLGFAILQAIL